MTAVVGLGYRFRRDDAAGLEVARRLRQAAPGEVRVLELEGEPISLLEAWRDADRVLAVDAVSSGSKPGTLYRFDAGARPLPAKLFRGSTHAIGLAEAVELGRELGRLPRRLDVYGIEGESFGMGEGLSEVAEGAVEALVAELSAELSVRAPRSSG